MKLGLLADIHECNDPLRTALGRFSRDGVDQVVVLGDVFLIGEQLDETCRLLSETKAIGVWGNHDFGLSHNPDDQARKRFGHHVIQFMTSLQPRLEIDGCLFTHVEPWLNPEDIVDLWYFDGPPDTPEKAARSFRAAPNQFMFVGHLHRWLAVTPNELLPWRGEESICFAADARYLVSIAAVCDGRYAIFDTDTRELVPFDEGDRKLHAADTC